MGNMKKLFLIAKRCSKELYNRWLFCGVEMENMNEIGLDGQEMFYGTFQTMAYLRCGDGEYKRNWS